VKRLDGMPNDDDRDIMRRERRLERRIEGVEARGAEPRPLGSPPGHEEHGQQNAEQNSGDRVSGQQLHADRPGSTADR
jgi:hypothetical protein